MNDAIVEVEFGSTNWYGNEVKITVQHGDRKRTYERYNESPSFGRLCRIVNSRSWLMSATQDGWQACLRRQVRQRG